MNHSQLAFIGGGNMAQSLVGGLIADGWPSQKITVSEPTAEKRADLKNRYGIKTVESNEAALKQAECVVLAVKPQVMHSVMEELAASEVRAPELIISIAAGCPTSSIEDWYRQPLAIVRAMPNTPALLGVGATGLYANPRVTSQQQDLAESILRAVGIVQWVGDEIDIDRVTAVSGSGPAYFFLLMEAMIDAAEEIGLTREKAAMLVKQTALGAGRMALESHDSPATLRQNVTSPGGTTEAALKAMEESNIRETITRGVKAAFERSKELGNLLGEKL